MLSMLMMLLMHLIHLMLLMLLMLNYIFKKGNISEIVAQNLVLLDQTNQLVVNVSTSVTLLDQKLSATNISSILDNYGKLFRLNFFELAFA